MNKRHSRLDQPLTIRDEVLKKWSSHRQFAPVTTEACGVLIGGYDTESDSYLIEKVTTPLPMDVRRRSFFTMQDKGHQQAVDAEYKASGGKHIYLGTWHTHPESRPNPSSVDIKDWRACIKRNNGRKLFFVIVGTAEVRVFTQENNQFKSILSVERTTK